MSLATPDAASDPTLTALRVLRAGYPALKPDIDEDTVWLWQQALGRYPADVLIAAAARWAETMPGFPSLHAFLGQVRALIRERSKGAPPCDECGGSTWVPVEGERYVRGCSRCRPDDYQAWREAEG